MSEADQRAWGDFWAQQSTRSQGGCLPSGWQGIDAIQQNAWHGFIKDAPEGARVLDLATGDGCVMRWMRDMRPDLTLHGVDLAPKLPPAPEGTHVQGGIAMEELPFDEGSFDVVVSQFGFEYGDVAKVSSEIARVLAHGGRAALMTHRLDGPILAHNKNRRMQIGWVLDRKDVIGLARRILAQRPQRGNASPLEIEQIVREGAHRFGPQSAAWEIPEAVRRSLLAPTNVPSALIEAALDKIVSQAANEMGRIDSLEAACKTTADADALTQAFEGAGLKQVSSVPLAEDRETSPFADFRVLSALS